MARKKNEVKAKRARKARFKKTVERCNQSIYLDIYYKGKRYYEFLKLYLTRNVSLKTVIRTGSLCAWPIVSRHNGSLIFRTRFMVSV